MDKNQAIILLAQMADEAMESGDADRATALILGASGAYVADEDKLNSMIEVVYYYLIGARTMGGD